MSAGKAANVVIDRRKFIKNAAIAGGALAGATALSGCRGLYPTGFQPGSSLIDGLASDCGIDTVVVVMMENRSFDHWLGWLATHENYLEQGRSRYGAGFGIDGNQHQTYTGPTGLVDTAYLPNWDKTTDPWRGCGFGDPGHSWTAGRAQRDGGFLATGANNSEFALGYYGASDLPFSSRLAKRFTTFDGYHCSILGPTYPNREYLNAAQSGGIKNNYLPLAEGGFLWETIWDRFAAAGVPARSYYSDLPVLALWGNRLMPYVSQISNYFTDCASGSLPNVVFVDPAFVGDNRNDDHPLADICAGQGFLRDVFQAFAKSNHWERGLFVATYDEWGGFFDHAAPPHLPDDRTNAIDAEDFSQAGFRVPTVMASPFARPGFVDSRTYDHTSVLRFLEWRFLGAPPEGPGAEGDNWFLTQRDRYANNLGASLMAESFSPDIWFDPASLEVGTPSPVCAPIAPTPGIAAANFGPLDNAFDEDKWALYLDTLNF